MTFKECKQLIKEDFNRTNRRKTEILFNDNFKLVFWFRIASYLKQLVGGKFYALIPTIILRHYKYKMGILIGVGTKVGGGLLFSHYSGVVINSGAVIGRNCTILQCVTIGSVYGPKGGVPQIGDNVVLAAGAKVIGNIRIGNNVMVGAGAVVVKDVPDNAVVVGNPAKVVSFEGERHVSYYIK